MRIREQILRCGLLDDPAVGQKRDAVGDMPGLGITAAPTPNARTLAGRVLSLPCTPELSDAEVDSVCHALGEAMR